MDAVRRTLCQVGEKLGRSPEQVAPYVLVLEENWFDTLQSLQKLNEDDLTNIGFPLHFAKELVSCLADSAVEESGPCSQPHDQCVEEDGYADPETPLQGLTESCQRDVQSLSEFLAGMPEDKFSSEEVELRQALLYSIQSRINDGPDAPVLLSQVASDPWVALQVSICLPMDVPLAGWIESRIGGEVEVLCDAHGDAALHLKDGARARSPDVDEDGDLAVERTRAHNETARKRHWGATDADQAATVKKARQPRRGTHPNLMLCNSASSSATKAPAPAPAAEKNHDAQKKKLAAELTEQLHLCLARMRSATDEDSRAKFYSMAEKIGKKLAEVRKLPNVTWRKNRRELQKQKK